VGWDEFYHRLSQDKSVIYGRRSKDWQHAVIDMGKYEPFLHEADTLVALGEWRKAANILEGLFAPEDIQPNPDFPFLQAIAISYATCLLNLGNTVEAVQVLETLSTAKVKPAEFFVNYSNTLNHARSYRKAEAVAREGLRLFPFDKDILGNLTISLWNQGKLSQACETATQRLKLGKDVHSLDEMAIVLLGIGRDARDADYPSAVKNYADALSYLRQAKVMNPRYLDGRFNLARTWFVLEEYARSAGELNDIVGSKLPLPPAYLELWALQKAECMDRTAMFDECRRFCDDWLRKLPNSILLKRIRAESMTDYFIGIGKEKDGIRLVEREALEFFTDVAAQADRRKATDLIYLARIKEWMGDVEEAFALFDEAEKLASNEWETPYCRALCYWRLKDFESALLWANKACARGPWNPKSYVVLSTICKSKGAEREAQEYERKADSIGSKREQLRKSAVSRQN
jgi:tetratricopeptide (TPR) repeat protein